MQLSDHFGCCLHKEGFLCNIICNPGLGLSGKSRLKCHEDILNQKSSRKSNEEYWLRKHMMDEIQQLLRRNIITAKEFKELLTLLQRLGLQFDEEGFITPIKNISSPENGKHLNLWQRRKIEEIKRAKVLNRDLKTLDEWLQALNGPKISVKKSDAEARDWKPLEKKWKERATKRLHQMQCNRRNLIERFHAEVGHTKLKEKNSGKEAQKSSKDVKFSFLKSSRNSNMHNAFLSNPSIKVQKRQQSRHPKENSKQCTDDHKIVLPNYQSNQQYENSASPPLSRLPNFRLRKSEIKKTEMNKKCLTLQKAVMMVNKEINSQKPKILKIPKEFQKAEIKNKNKELSPKITKLLVNKASNNKKDVTQSHIIDYELTNNGNENSKGYKKCKTDKGIKIKTGFAYPLKKSCSKLNLGTAQIDGLIYGDPKNKNEKCPEKMESVPHEDDDGKGISTTEIKEYLSEEILEEIVEKPTTVFTNLEEENDILACDNLRRNLSENTEKTEEFPVHYAHDITNDTYLTSLMNFNILEEREFGTIKHLISYLIEEVSNWELHACVQKQKYLIDTVILGAFSNEKSLHKPSLAIIGDEKNSGNFNKYETPSLDCIGRILQFTDSNSSRDHSMNKIIENIMKNILIFDSENLTEAENFCHNNFFRIYKNYNLFENYKPETAKHILKNTMKSFTGPNLTVDALKKHFLIGSKNKFDSFNTSGAETSLVIHKSKSLEDNFKTIVVSGTLSSDIAGLNIDYEIGIAKEIIENVPKIVSYQNLNIDVQGKCSIIQKQTKSDDFTESVVRRSELVLCEFRNLKARSECLKKLKVLCVESVKMFKLFPDWEMTTVKDEIVNEAKCASEQTLNAPPQENQTLVKHQMKSDCYASSIVTRNKPLTQKYKISELKSENYNNLHDYWTLCENNIIKPTSPKIPVPFVTEILKMAHNKIELESIILPNTRRKYYQGTIKTMCMSRYASFQEQNLTDIKINSMVTATDNQGCKLLQEYKIPMVSNFYATEAIKAEIYEIDTPRNIMNRLQKITYSDKIEKDSDDIENILNVHLSLFSQESVSYVKQRHSDYNNILTATDTRNRICSTQDSMDIRKKSKSNNCELLAEDAVYDTDISKQLIKLGKLSSGKYKLKETQEDSLIAKFESIKLCEETPIQKYNTSTIARSKIIDNSQEITSPPAQTSYFDTHKMLLDKYSASAEYKNKCIHSKKKRLSRKKDLTFKGSKRVTCMDNSNDTSVENMEYLRKRISFDFQKQISLVFGRSKLNVDLEQEINHYEDFNIKDKLITLCQSSPTPMEDVFLPSNNAKSGRTSMIIIDAQNYMQPYNNITDKSPRQNSVKNIDSQDFIYQCNRSQEDQNCTHSEIFIPLQTYQKGELLRQMSEQIYPKEINLTTVDANELKSDDVEYIDDISEKFTSLSLEDISIDAHEFKKDKLRKLISNKHENAVSNEYVYSHEVKHDHIVAFNRNGNVYKSILKYCPKTTFLPKQKHNFKDDIKIDAVKKKICLHKNISLKKSKESCNTMKVSSNNKNIYSQFYTFRNQQVSPDLLATTDRRISEIPQNNITFAKYKHRDDKLKNKTVNSRKHPSLINKVHIDGKLKMWYKSKHFKEDTVYPNQENVTDYATIKVEEKQLENDNLFKKRQVEPNKIANAELGIDNISQQFEKLSLIGTSPYKSKHNTMKSRLFLDNYKRLNAEDGFPHKHKYSSSKNNKESVHEINVSNKVPKIQKECRWITQKNDRKQKIPMKNKINIRPQKQTKWSKQESTEIVSNNRECTSSKLIISLPNSERKSNNTLMTFKQKHSSPQPDLLHKFKHWDVKSTKIVKSCKRLQEAICVAKNNPKHNSPDYINEPKRNSSQNGILKKKSCNQVACVNGNQSPCLKAESIEDILKAFSELSVQTSSPHKNRQNIRHRKMKQFN